MKCVSTGFVLMFVVYLVLVNVVCFWECVRVLLVCVVGVMDNVPFF